MEVFCNGKADRAQPVALSIAPLEALRGFGSAHITTNIQPIAVTTGRKCIAKRKLAKEAELAVFKAQTSPKYTPLEITVMAIKTGSEEKEAYNAEANLGEGCNKTHGRLCLFKL